MISVVIPAYNAADYLPACLDSVLAQTYADIEVIIVNDGSTDGTRPIIERYAAADTRVHAVHQPNRGQSAARNAGIEIARGKYIMFIDADDMIVPDCLERLLDMGSDTDIAVGAFSFQKSTRLRRRKSAKTTAYTPAEALENMLYQHNLYSSACCMLLPAYLFADIRFREGVWYEDLEILPRLFMACRGKIVSTDQLLYLYRKHEGSFIHTFDSKRLDVLKVTSEIADRYAGHPRLAAAARDRRFSANFNMLVLCSNSGLTAVADECWQVIRSSRRATLLDPRVRLKNKLGAILSYLGRPLTLSVSRLFYS